MAFPAIGDTVSATHAGPTPELPEALIANSKSPFRTRSLQDCERLSGNGQKKTAAESNSAAVGT